MTLDTDSYILAIDLGTSGPKIVLASTHGEIADWEFEATPLLLFPDGGAEQRPDDWWNAIKKATARLLARCTIPIDHITAICCTAQWSGTVAVDRDGTPLMNALSWMDSRGASYIDHITDGPIKIAGYSIGKLLRWIWLTGGAPAHAGKDPIAHILYIKHQHPDIYRQTYKFLEPKDYLNLRLTGQFAASHESITLHWLTDNRNISNIVYHDKLIALSTIDRDKLPDLKRAIDILGPLKPEIAAELGLGNHVRVIMGTPDLHSAALGSGGIRDYQAHLYIGTSSWLLCHVPFKKTDILHNIAALPSAIPGRYLLSNEQETAGACLTFLRDNLLYPDDELTTGPKHANTYAAFDRIVEQTAPGSDHLIFTPWLYGERAPIDDHNIRGSFYNISLRTTRAQLIRAVFEGVALNSRWLLTHVEKLIKRQLSAINLIGGGANSNTWCQIYADILNRPIRQVADSIHANARGAVLLATVALGYGTFDDLADHVRIAHTYQPNPANRQIYDELFAAFVQIYKQNKHIHARLNKHT